MELALVLVPLIMLVFGIVEFSRVSYQKLELAHAAREVTRAIALQYDDGASIDDIVDDALNRALTPQLQDVTSLSELVTCTLDSPPQADARVELTRPVDLSIPFFDDDLPAISAHAVMPCEG